MYYICSKYSIEVVASTGTTTDLDFEGKTTTTYIDILRKRRNELNHQF